MTDQEREHMGTTYFILRHEMVELIRDKIISRNKETESKREHENDDDDGNRALRIHLWELHTN